MISLLNSSTILASSAITSLAAKDENFSLSSIYNSNNARLVFENKYSNALAALEKKSGKKYGLNAIIIRPERRATVAELQAAYVSALKFENSLQTCKKNGKKVNFGDTQILGEYRLLILETIDLHLRKILESSSKNENNKENELGDDQKQGVFAAIKSMFGQIGYYVLLITGMVIDSAACFLGSQELLAFFSVFSPTTSLVIGLVFSVVNSVLFYSFEAGMLRKAMNIESMDEASLLLNFYDKEIKTAANISRKMLDPLIIKALKWDDYEAFAKATAVFNHNIKKKDLSKPKEKLGSKLLRHIVIAIGTIMMLWMSYFMVNSLLTFFAAALIGTPIGWGIIGFGMITGLAYFLSMRGSAVTYMLNPALQHFKEVKQKLADFEAKEEIDFKCKYLCSKHPEVKESMENGFSKELIDKKPRPSVSSSHLSLYASNNAGQDTHESQVCHHDGTVATRSISP